MLLLDIIPLCVYNITMYSVKEAAQKLGLDTSQVRRLLAKGEIEDKKIGCGGWYWIWTINVIEALGQRGQEQLSN